MLKQLKEISLKDLRQGDESVFTRIYEDNREKFLNFSWKYGLSREENIDIYQDTYIIFYENVMSGKIKEFTSSISTYLFSIGKHLILDELRKKKKNTTGFDVSLVKDEAVQEMEMDTTELTTEQSLLLKYFNTLGKQCQYLLTLFYYNGLTIEEIMIKGAYKSQNVVKSQKSRCLKTLKERIKADAK